MLGGDSRKAVAVALVLTLTFITMPVSAADLSTPRPVLGSVSGVGGVELRGFAISQEGTLFAGDSIRAREKAYAKVLLGNGSKLELAEKTDVTVSSDNQGVKIAMNAGTVGFTARKPLRIDVPPFEIVASDDAAGNVGIMSATSAGVRTFNGKVTVRNMKTSESFVLLKGQERLLGLRDGTRSASLADIASNVPLPVPDPVPQTPAGRTGGGLAMDTGGWIAVIAGAAVAGLAITGLVIALNNRDDIDDANAANDALRAQLDADRAATRAALNAVSNAAALSQNAAQVQTTAAVTASLAAQTEAALRVSQPALATQAAGFVTAANAASAQAATLQAQINALQAQIATAGTATSAQLSTLTTLQNALATQRNNLNAAITSLNALLANPIVMNTPGAPRTSITVVPPPTLASPS
jgi:hypothetical protein